jgi:hypothetical protein
MNTLTDYFKVIPVPAEDASLTVVVVVVILSAAR